MEESDKKMICQMQRFTVSAIGMLNLLQMACVKKEDTSLPPKIVKSKKVYMESSQSIIDNLKNNNGDNSDHTRIIKKAFNTLKTETQCKFIQEKNPELFNTRDNNNKIITILPGIDLRVGYEFLDEGEKKQFWQYFYLFSSSVFNMIKYTNEKKFEKYTHVCETMKFIEEEMSKTGVLFNNMVFNPFIGLNVDNTGKNYSVDELFTGDALPNKQDVSIDSILSMMGVSKMFDEDKLNEELKGIGDKQINEATDKIVSLLGAGDNSDVKDVCNNLIQDIVLNFKENGIGNIGETLKKVAENAKVRIDSNKMKKTAESMKYFMENSQEKMKNLKDEDGKPINQQLLNSLAGPMSMMNMFAKK